MIYVGKVNRPQGLKRSHHLLLSLSKDRVAIATCHRLSGLNNINLFAHSSENWKSKVGASAGLASSEASCSGLRIVIFPTSLNTQPFFGSPCVQISYNERINWV